MLQNIRQQTQGTTAKIIIGLIVISFAFFGIESILVSGGGSEIAEVNGESIYPQELQLALDTQKRRLIAMMGDRLDPAMLDDETLTPQALDALINRKLLMQSAQAMQLEISEREIGQVVGSMEQFQVDGVFSPEVYKGALASAGYTPAYFKESLRDDMLLTQLRSGLAGSEFVTPSELQLNAQVLAEQRDLRYFVLPKEDFKPTSEVTEEQIAAYYASHEDEFRTLESLDLDYLQLSLDDFRQPVEESAVVDAYELAKQDFQYQTQNRVSHILLEAGDTQQSRLADAQQQLASGVSFADVAKALSDDVGSADNGGDLGYSAGSTFPEDMEAAIAQLEPGVVSAPVETDAGIHLIVVTERKPGAEPTLEEMRKQLTETLQSDEARIALLRTVEELRDLVFNAEDLGYPAQELDLNVKTANGISRSQQDGLFANPVLVDAAFSDDVLVAGNNSAVIELAGNNFVVLRVRKHNTPQTKPLADVREEVIASIIEDASREAVVTAANEAVDKLASGAALDEIADSYGYTLQTELGVDRRNVTVPPAVLQHAFQLSPPTQGVSTDFIQTSTGDAIIIELQRATPGKYDALTATEQAQLQQQLIGEFGSLVDNEFQRGLQERAEITVL